MEKQKEIPSKITFFVVIFLLPNVLLFSSCNIKFNKAQWLSDNSGFPPGDRKIMLHDLITNYKLVGLKKSELENLLGNPDFIDSTDLKDSMTSTYTYEIEVHYDMIDPDYIKDLNFTLTKDSIVKSFKVTEWKK